MRFFVRQGGRALLLICVMVCLCGQTSTKSNMPSGNGDARSIEMTLTEDSWVTWSGQANRTITHVFTFKADGTFRHTESSLDTSTTTGTWKISTAAEGRIFIKTENAGNMESALGDATIEYDRTVDRLLLWPTGSKALMTMARWKDGKPTTRWSDQALADATRSESTLSAIEAALTSGAWQHDSGKTKVTYHFLKDGKLKVELEGAASYSGTPSWTWKLQQNAQGQVELIFDADSAVARSLYWLTAHSRIDYDKAADSVVISGQAYDGKQMMHRVKAGGE